MTMVEEDDRHLRHQEDKSSCPAHTQGEPGGVGGAQSQPRLLLRGDIRKIFGEYLVNIW